MNRYQNIPRITIDGKKVYRTVRYPSVPLNEQDIYVITTVGDRFDILAQQYYKDSSLWWIISIANEQLAQNTLVIPEGIQIRIPYNPYNVVDSYNQINS
jgi:phage tail protein X